MINVFQQFPLEIGLVAATTIVTIHYRITFGMAKNDKPTIIPNVHEVLFEFVPIHMASCSRVSGLFLN